MKRAALVVLLLFGSTLALAQGALTVIPIPAVLPLFLSALDVMGFR